MQALLATASVIALVVIAFNLLVTFGLLLMSVFFLERWTHRLSAWVAATLEQGGTRAGQAAVTVETVSRKVVAPVIQVERSVEQARSVLKHLDLPRP